MARTKQTARAVISCKVQKNFQQEKAIKDDEFKVDFNMFSYKFDDQKECEKNSCQDQILKCQNCESVLHFKSTIISMEDYEKVNKLNDNELQRLQNLEGKIWVCDFCEYANIVNDNVKLPLSQNPCYLIEDNKQIADLQGVKTLDQNDITIIFCLDLSGSMEISVIQANQLQKQQTQKEFLSRLDCMQESVKDELFKIRDNSAQIKVGLVVFSNNVRILGDCSQKQQIIDQQSMNNYDQIIQQVNQYDNLIQLQIEDAFSDLKKKLISFEGNGATALGPALLASIVLASKGLPGSKVIICTDGLANMGVGCLDGGKPDIEFYDRAAQFGKQKGVQVNILTIKGDAQCSVKNLGKVADATNGRISRVDPSKLGGEFSKIVEDEVIGTNCNIEVHLNQLMKFRKEEEKYLSQNGSVLKKFVGNISEESDLYFEFDMRGLDELKQQFPLFEEKLLKRKEIPIQVLATYTNKKKQIFQQVFTDFREVMESEEKINQEMKNLNIGQIQAQAQRMASKLAQNGEYERAEKCLGSYENYIQQNIQQSSVNDKNVQRQQNKLQDLRCKIESKVSRNKQYQNQSQGLSKFNPLNWFKSNNNDSQYLESKQKTEMDMVGMMDSKQYQPQQLLFKQKMNFSQQQQISKNFQPQFNQPVKEKEHIDLPCYMQKLEENHDSDCEDESIFKCQKVRSQCNSDEEI